MKWSQTRARGWRRVLVLAGLVVGLVLMHGVGLGHGPLPMTSVETASTASHVGVEHPGPPGHSAATLPAAGSDDGHDSEHTGWAQMCLAVLGAVAVASMSLLRLREDHTSRPGGQRQVGMPQRGWTFPPGDGPSLHQLCVLRI